MDDKGRCLEQLSKQVQRLTLVSVQKLFLSGEVETGANLLSQWEQYLELSKYEASTQAHETLTSTIQLFCKRLAALQNVLNSLPKQRCVQDLQEELHVLEKRFASTKIGIGGGTFEWVDSVLVKCLREGSWLVIDNVNLCSPAVLDRLNGLLEPGGELILGERGVGGDGQLVKVKPHPHFRLFLVMDPHFGEISRAMRNRGVEICLLNSEEKSIPLMDLQAILSHIGISQYNHQKALINIHEETKNLAVGVDSLTTSHLFQAAALTVQQVVRGRQFSMSLHSACSDVYIQSRQLTGDQRERCAQLLYEVFHEQDKLLNATDPDVRDNLDTRVVTLRTLALQENSTLSQLQQKCALLSAVLKLLDKSKSYTLKDLIKDDLKNSKEALFDKNLFEVVPYVMLTLVSYLSETDLYLRRNMILSTIISSLKSVELRNKLAEFEKYLTTILQQALKSNNLSDLKGVQRKDLCWDLRRVSPWILDSTQCDYENKTIALLYYIMQYLQLEMKLGEIKTTVVRNMSALDFSTAHNKGKVSIASVKSPIILELSMFLEALQDLVQLLPESDARLDEEQCCQLISAVQWSHRLLRVSQRKLFVGRSKDMEVSEELTMLLGLHISWVKKWLLPILSRLFNPHPQRQGSGKLPKQLSKMCSTENLRNPVKSLSKKVRSLLGQPLPLREQLQGQLLETIVRLEATTDFFTVNQHQKVIQKTVEYLKSSKGRRMRLNSTKSFQSVWSCSDLIEVQQQLKYLESRQSFANLSIETPIEEDKDSLTQQHTSSWCWEVSLWPVKGVVCLRLMSAVRNCPSDQLVDCTSSWAKELLLVPTKVLARLNNMADNKLSAMTLLMNQLTQSPIVTSPRMWLNWGFQWKRDNQLSFGIEMEEECRSRDNKEYHLQSPLLAVFTTALLYPGCHSSVDHSVATPSLRSHRQQVRLLASLLETIWTNGPGLATSTLNYRKNEAECIENRYREFLHVIQTVVQSKLADKELSQKEKHIFMFLDELLGTKSLSESSKMKGQSKMVEEMFIDVSRHVDTLESAIKNLHQEETESVRWLWIGLAWTHLGLLQLKLFSHQDQVDPVQKNSLKVQYCQEEREELERSLAVEQVQGLILGCYHFPLGEAFGRRVNQLQDKEDRLKKFVAERPQLNCYSSLYNEIQQLMAVLVRPGQRVEAVAASLCACVVNSKDNKTAEATTKEIQEALSRSHSLHTSILKSANSLDKTFGIWYPDVVVPIFSAMSQISHGLSLMTGAVKNYSVNKQVHVEPVLRSLIRFPLPDRSAALRLVDICTSTEFLEIVHAVVKPKLKEGETLCNETFRLAKCSLQELRNVVSVRGRLWEGGDWSVVCSILDHLVTAWQKQEQDRALQEQQDSNYFINKARNIENLTEEEEDALEMRKLFPSYRDKDFADLEPPSLEEKKVLPHTEDNAQDPHFKLTLDNIIEIHKVHSSIVTKNTKAHWLPITEPESLNFISPFAERFTIFSVLLDSLYAGCDSTLDAEVTPALCLGVHLASANGTVEMQNTRKHYDFYHDANISEVKLCVPVLESLTKRVVELLEEWSDHPTLNQIITVIDRILDFPSQSPVSRFLVGLELLLTKLKEWEENAHAGVTLGPHAAAVTRQILDWRRLELSHWKGCLESAKIRLCEGVVSKWWFHLYSLVRESGDDIDNLAAVLEQFMESSNMAEYQTRLDLLYTFHCHTVNCKQRMQSNVLWNVHQYYSQFSRVIARRIKELSLPVEKKLRDFVKIARWNDINYWAVKQTVEKTHRTLFKYIREFEGILKQPARNAMTRLDAVNKEATLLSVNPTFYMAHSILVEILDGDTEGESLSADSLLSRHRSLFNRARKLCGDSVTNCPLPRHIAALQLILDELQETSLLLNTEDVDRTVSKEKQKSAARSVLHCKRKALTDLFHTLVGLGLSYRTGLVVVEEGVVAGAQFTLHAPLNVEAGLAQIDNKAADKELLAAWAGCDEYFLHSVAHLAQLKRALASPHKDLGPAIIDRCKGFTNHLMSFCHAQKRSVAQSVTSLYVLRCLTQQLASLQSAQISPTDVTMLKDDLVSVLEDIIYCLSQFDILLDSCPVRSEIVDLTEEVQTTPLIPEATEVVMYRGDGHWTKSKSKVSSTMKNANKAKTLLEEKGKYAQFLENFQKTDGSEVEFRLTCEDFQTVKDGFTYLSAIKNDIREIQHVFRMEIEGDVNPMVHSLNHLQQKIEQSLEKFSYHQAKFEDLNNVAESENEFEEVSLKSSIEVLLNKILFVIQEFYKQYAQKETENTEHSDVTKTENDIDIQLYDSHLKEKIVTALQNNVQVLKLPEVTKQLQNLLLQCKSNNIGKFSIGHLKRSMPLLQQYSLLAQFLVTQQVSALHSSSQLCSALLSVFVDLSNKGFRVPEELLEEEDGEGTQSTAGGLGLGEGEGEKDVSDQIESQDQLEDAKKPGEHDQDEDKDCKEEEKGVEMSDDFGGKLQDIERKDDEDGNSEESGDEEEPDKEMGDTEKGADTLDQQIWGESDSEEENGDTGEKEEEQGDRGEQISEKEMGAKDENKTPQSEEDNQGSEEKENKKKDINEMEEPDVDDDQIDPYHGKHPPQPEPEPLDLPDDLQLDDGEGKDKDDEGEEENPFEIDAMKEPKLPEEESAEDATEEQTDKDKDKENSPETDSSDEEGDGDGGIELPEEMDVDETDKVQDNDQSADDGGAKDENKTGEEAKMEEDEKKNEEDAKPSEDLPAAELVPSSQHDSGSKDQVRQPESGDQSKELSPEESAADGEDQQGVGAAHNEQQEAQRGSKGDSQQAIQSQASDLREEKRDRPGESEEQRALGDVQEPLKKKLKTINVEKENEVSQEHRDEEGIQEDQSAEMYQHIKEAKETNFDAQTLDAATEKQVSEQKVPNKEDEEADELKDDKDMVIDEEEPKMETENVTKVNPEKIKEGNKDKEDGVKQPSADGERVEADAQMDVEGEVIQTMTVERGAESSFYTTLEIPEEALTIQHDVEVVRKELEQQLSTWCQPPASEEAAHAWELLSSVTSSLSRELSEQLRLVLEPTHASRLKGDFRTGRRINMRKVIPYIASQFRKDKIWLRRTKPAKREYQIVLAIDDSSSMADNHSKELAFESLAVVSKALSLLEAGQLSVLSFGDKPKILHQLGDPFTEHSGARLLQQFSFEQQKTQVGALVNFACSLFERNPPRRGLTDVAQLLVIVSDGRGVLNDGEQIVRQAVRRAKQMGIFMVFVIVDNPRCKDSILDIRLPKFSGGKLLGIVPYMDSFPFPFYLILRDINSLPSVLSDALRQWFELVTSTS